MLPGRIAWRIISSDAQKDNKSNLHNFLWYINIIISYYFMTSRSPGEKRAEKRIKLDAAIFFIITAVIGWTTAHGELHMYITCDLDWTCF